MKLLLRGLIVFSGLLLFWQFTVILFQLPPYILPTPIDVIYTLHERAGLILSEARITLVETLTGLVLGTLLGCIAAICMAYFRKLNYWLLPILVISQAIPTFAIAPLLVIWFGYGLASKIVTTIIMLFFPITSAFLDGLRRADPHWIDLAKTMNVKKSRYFWYIRIPQALPHLASGLRIAAVIAPIGAVVGEWVGASSGLGFLMLNANARMQIDLMFAGLFTLILFSLLLYFGVDFILKKAIWWK